MVANERQTHVGCSAVTYSKQTGKELIMACSFATFTNKTQPIYTLGSPTSGCQTGYNLYYPALCSEQEEYVTIPIRG